MMSTAKPGHSQDGFRATTVKCQGLLSQPLLHLREQLPLQCMQDSHPFAINSSWHKTLNLPSVFCSSFSTCPFLLISIPLCSSQSNSPVLLINAVICSSCPCQPFTKLLSLLQHDEMLPLPSCLTPSPPFHAVTSCYHVTDGSHGQKRLLNSKSCTEI